MNVNSKPNLACKQTHLYAYAYHSEAHTNIYHEYAADHFHSHSQLYDEIREQFELFFYFFVFF